MSRHRAQDRTNNKLGFNCLLLIPGYVFECRHPCHTHTDTCVFVRTLCRRNSTAGSEGLDAMSFIKLIGQTKWILTICKLTAEMYYRLEIIWVLRPQEANKRKSTS